MQTMANTYRSKNITYKSFATDSALSNHTENLRREVGVDASSKYAFYYVYVYGAFHLTTSRMRFDR